MSESKEIENLEHLLKLLQVRISDLKSEIYYLNSDLEHLLNSKIKSLQSDIEEMLDDKIDDVKSEIIEAINLHINNQPKGN